MLTEGVTDITLIRWKKRIELKICWFFSWKLLKRKMIYVNNCEIVNKDYAEAFKLHIEILVPNAQCKNIITQSKSSRNL